MTMMNRRIISNRVSSRLFRLAHVERCNFACIHGSHKTRALLILVLLAFVQVPIAISGEIHRAAKNGDLAALETALNAGADVNESAGGLTPLFYAASRGQVEAANLLIAHGADVNGMTLLGTPLMAAASSDRSGMVELLLAEGADANADKESQTALHVASEHGCLGCVKALVEAGANVNARHRIAGAGKIVIVTPLHLAILNGHQDIADHLIAHGVVFPKLAPISARLAATDPGKGQDLFERECRSCHAASVEPGLGAGPNLWNVVGRDKASLDGYRGYSEALLAQQGDWTYEDLNVFQSGPAVTTPGVKMSMQGLPDEDDRTNVIAYLRTLSDNPVPLP